MSIIIGKNATVQISNQSKFSITSEYTTPPSGKTFYVSNLGSDTNNGLTPQTSWRNLSKVNSAGNNGTIKAGDTILFKSGDTFYCQNRSGGGFRWWNNYGGNTCPSGTENAPITFSSYGTGDKPNFLYPSDVSNINAWNKIVLSFRGVNYIILDGLQFNDPRLPIITYDPNETNFNTTPPTQGVGNPYTAIKVGGAQTGQAVSFGEGDGVLSCNNIIARNCYMNNVGYGFATSGNNNLFINNYIENMGQCYPFGINSYGPVGIEIRGNNNTIIYNTIKNAWAWADVFSWNGGALEIVNTNTNSTIMYNTFVDCAGVAEFGQNTAGQSTSNILIAYNKIINCGSVSYANTSGNFAIDISNVKLYNNVIVENSLSRFTGVNFASGAGDFPTNQVGSCPRYPEPSTSMVGSGASSDIRTLYYLKNNVFQLSNAPITWTDAYNNGVCNATRTYTPAGFSTNSRITGSYNVYKLTNGSIVGHTLGVAEVSTAVQLFTNTTSPDPEIWDYSPIIGTPLIDAGIDVGLTQDFAGNIVSNPPEIGILEYI